VLSASDSISHFAHNRSTVAALVVLSGGVLLVGAAARARVAVIATGLSIAAVLALTLPPAGGWHLLATAHWDSSLAVSALHPTRDALRAWHAGTDGLLNVALYVPLGLAATVATRRPLCSLVSAVTLSTAIELYQAGTGLRVGSAADVVSNGLGALLGAGLGAVVLAARRLDTPRDREQRVTSR
jgi:VanZ family protein